MITDRKLVLILFLSLLGSLVAAVGLAQSRPLSGQNDVPATPTNIKCLGLAEDEVKLVWTDNADDETNYRIERRIGDDGWHILDTVISPNDGRPVVYVDPYIDSSDQDYLYRVRAYRAADDTLSLPSESCNNPRIYESYNFRIFYGLQGEDACPIVLDQLSCLYNPVHLIKYGGALEGARASFLRVGFERDVAESPYDKKPAAVNMCDNGGCGGTPIQVAPFLLEKNYDFGNPTNPGDPAAHVITAHELFHQQQGRYGGLSDPAAKWVTEGQARSIQDKVCFGDRDNCIHFDHATTGHAGYVGQVNAYLGNTNRPINQASYTAALFWTYLTEQYGLYQPSDPVEGGMDLIANFWESSAADPGRDGITILNSALAQMGHSETFRDVWKDFAVANYAKDLGGPNVPDKYRYKDMAQPGGNYDPVALTLDETLAPGEQLIETAEAVTQWGANYYRLRPDGNLPFIDLSFIQDSPHMLSYTVLGIKDDDLLDKDTHHFEARDLHLHLPNDDFDEVVIIVAGLENPANYRYSINGTEPELRIETPTSENLARVGDPDAPDKFMAKIEIVAPDGSPVEGIDLDRFTFTVGDVEVPADNILTSATVQNQQWFVIRAPAQSSVDFYDFSVDYNGELHAENANAVWYYPRNDADSVLLLDHSGSMDDPESKLESAQAAARLYVDSWREGDQIGVLSFSDDPVVELGLTPWTDASRQDAFNAINSLTADGATNIGDSLRVGWDELIDHGEADHDWAIILLSDGNEMNADPEESFDQIIETLDETTERRPVVHAIAVGDDADRIRMQEVAAATGGTFSSVSVPATFQPTASDALQEVGLQLDLDFQYRMIAAEVLGRQPFFTFVGPGVDRYPEWDVVPIPVENGAAELVVSASWVDEPGVLEPGSVILRDPADNVVPVFQIDDRHHVWRVTNPTGGEWSLRLDLPEPPASVHAPDDELPPYLVQATVHSDVTMDLELTTAVEDRHPGATIGMVASLTGIAPITGATVEATIVSPSGTVHEVSLHDDGLHDDGAAGDGLYGAFFHNTGEGGSYDVTVLANGTTRFSGDFVRLQTASFHLRGDEDADSDSLPDGWEIYFFGSIESYDADDDPDYDGCSNAAENATGADPTDPDTDDGGEADCADQYPHDPSNDALEGTWAVAYAGDGAVYLHYVDRSEPIATNAHILRRDGRALSYTSHHYGLATGVFSDTVDVENGTTYCYIVQVSTVAGYDSTVSPPTCTTPKSDPLAPHGYVVIEDGAGATYSDDVTLSLWATDHFDPEYDEYGPPRPVGTERSGVTDMMISNRSDMEGAAWQRFSTSEAWTLAPQRGSLATVYVKFRDGAGNQSDVYAASIHVEEAGAYLPLIMVPDTR